jgi:LytS/YehU family sensor histidine kinase
VLARLAACVAEQVIEIRASEVRRLVSQAELRALQSQIHPHFLFNALNALYGVIPREAAAARRMLLDLSEILRYFLKSERTFVPLDDEIRIVKAYLAIEQLRLGHKLKTEIEVDDAVAREVIPVLSIQPLVENAVKHGASARPQGGRVRVVVKLRSEGLHVLVQDTGPGFGSGIAVTDTNHAGVGLENVAQRLRLCYGPGAELLIESNHEGSSVSFVVPSHSAVALRA